MLKHQNTMLNKKSVVGQTATLSHAIVSLIKFVEIKNKRKPVIIGLGFVKKSIVSKEYKQEIGVVIGKKGTPQDIGSRGT
jgi:hypothetical protein